MIDGVDGVRVNRDTEGQAKREVGTGLMTGDSTSAVECVMQCKEGKQYMRWED